MDIPLYSVFLQALTQLFPTLGPDRGGLAWSDLDFITTNVWRVAETAQSGRDFVQQMPALGLPPPSVKVYFDTLRSPRRLHRVQQVQAALFQELQRGLGTLRDRLAAFPELAGRQVWAADGHAIEHATHDAPRRSSHGTWVRDPSHGIFALDLRTGLARVLAQCPGREHEIKTLKRADARQWGPKGTLGIYDPALIDFRYWYVLKQTFGVYIISRWKANLQPVHAIDLDWDRQDPRNAGILAVQRVGFNNSGESRKIVYQDPETHLVYEFLTSDMTLPPGVIVQLYRLRWDIEKVFDVFESKFQETKAWASTDTAKRMQNEFIVMAFNLMLALAGKLEREEGITDVKVARKYTGWMQHREAQAQAQQRSVSPWVKVLRRATQLSLQFIRWLRNHLRSRTPYAKAVVLLRPLMLAYLR